jgi:hypothetical protein
VYADCSTIVAESSIHIKRKEGRERMESPAAEEEAAIRVQRWYRAVADGWLPHTVPFTILQSLNLL